MPGGGAGGKIPPPPFRAPSTSPVLQMTPALAAAYRKCILGRPRAVLAVMMLILIGVGWQARDFRLDASADSLLLEDDPDLLRFREVQQRYGGGDLLVVAFTPAEPLFSDASLETLAALRGALSRIAGVARVTTILDVPLLESADVPLAEMAEKIRTLETPGIDRERARAELSGSPFFRELLISADARTTALLLSMQGDEALAGLGARRQELQFALRRGALDPAGERELQAVQARYEAAHERAAGRRRAEVAAIREALEPYRERGALHLGGVPMIAADMIAFIRNDLVIFGAGVFVFLVLTLGVTFRRVRWVLLPLASCAYAGTFMIGLLGLVGWKVTVISSNFLALMLIITISMNIHLAVRYRQLRRDHPEEGHAALVETTLRRMVRPCLYAALTTVIGFSSLSFSGIKPVNDFGWMMSIGLAVTFLTSFTLFPCALLLLGARREGAGAGEGRGTARAPFRFTAPLADLSARRGGLVLLATLGVALLSIAGVSRLSVENSFIDYFGRDTEIYRGMALIDRQLGGTTPLEVVLDLDEARVFGEEEDDEDELGDEYAGNPAYWFTTFKVDRIKQVHDYLDSLPEVGKVLSLASAIRVGEALNEGRPLDSFQLGLLYKRIPEEVRDALIAPYVSIENDEARILARILDSRPDLRRQELLERIRGDLRERFGFTEADVSLSGLLVLYNNMLQSLYRSQIATLGAVVAGVGLMLGVLFRSLTLALIGIVPNVLAAGLVLGVMGLSGIPLDLMTITMAAITIGIAVDNSIHYLYRFREELPRHRDYVETLHVCHATIGRAVFYTSCTIIFGFSVLVLSNFFPTIYFGVLTGLAMLMALLAALTLLPKLILITKPFPV